MSDARSMPHALIRLAKVAVAAVLLLGAALVAPHRSDALPSTPETIAANNALNVASARMAAARDTLARAQAAIPGARIAVTRSYARLVAANRVLVRIRAANGGYLRSLATATTAVQRARATYDAAVRAAALSTRTLVSAEAAKQAADAAVPVAQTAVDVAAQRVADLESPSPSTTATSTGSATASPSDTGSATGSPTDTGSATGSPTDTSPSGDLAAALAALAQAQQDLAAAQVAESAAASAYTSAVVRAAHDAGVRTHDLAVWIAARTRLAVIVAHEPGALASARRNAAAAAAAYRYALAVLGARGRAVSAATVGLNTTTAAFNRARSLALSAVRAVAQSPVCPTGNVYAGAVGTHILSLPGLTINRYQKAGRTPIWVTSVNLAGAGPQIRPGPLTPPVVAIRTQPLSQLHGSSALAAVNGDFYNIGQDNSPLGPEITRGGHVLKGSAAPRTNVLIVQRNGLATVDTVTLDVTLRHGAAAVHANSLNSHDLPGNGIAVLTSAWGPASRSYLHPTQAVNEFIVAPGGLVVAVSGRITARPIPARGMVIIAQGTGRQRMAAAGIRTGARISISTPVHSGAPGPVYSAIGVGIALIRHGIDKRLGCKDDFPVARTIVGIKAGGQQLFVVTVQGGSDSQRSNFTGLSVRQAQGLVRALGAYDAAMFDGGGSTELSAKVGRAYKMISRPPLRIRSIPNSFAFWPR